RACSRSRVTYAESLRSDPETVAPSAWATIARPLMPAPPIPMKWSRRAAHGAAFIAAQSCQQRRRGETASSRRDGQVSPRRRLALIRGNDRVQRLPSVTRLDERLEIVEASAYAA